MSLESYLRDRLTVKLDNIFNSLEEPARSILSSRNHNFEDVIASTISDAIEKYNADTVSALAQRISSLEQKVSTL